MKTLITGSDGYIGKHLMKMLAGTKYWKGTTEFIGNVTDPKAYKDLEPYYDNIIHLAAFVRVNESVNEPTMYYINNIMGTHELLTSVSFSNFIFASTGTASDPVNPYAYSKRVSEDIVADISKKRGANYTTFRFFNVTGSDGFPPSNPDGLLFNLIQATKHGKFYLYGNNYDTKDGTCVRDYIHVNEVCEAIIEAIELPANKIENLGSGIGYTVKEIIDTFKRVNNVDFEVIMEPRRPGDLERLVSLPSKASNYYTQSYTLDELMKVDLEALTWRT